MAPVALPVQVFPRLRPITKNEEDLEIELEFELELN